LVYDAATIRRLVDVFGATQVMVGTDYPFSIMDNEPIGRLESTGLTPDVIELLRSVNAARWLGLPAVQP
jgi:aminocarboxymuconate-semialdehyde decarboxylase